MCPPHYNMAWGGRRGGGEGHTKWVYREIQTTFSISPSWLWLRQSKTPEDALLMTKDDFGKTLRRSASSSIGQLMMTQSVQNVLPKSSFVISKASSSVLLCLNEFRWTDDTVPNRTMNWWYSPQWTDDTVHNELMIQSLTGQWSGCVSG